MHVNPIPWAPDILSHWSRGEPVKHRRPAATWKCLGNVLWSLCDPSKAMKSHQNTAFSDQNRRQTGRRMPSGATVAALPSRTPLTRRPQALPFQSIGSLRGQKVATWLSQELPRPPPAFTRLTGNCRAASGRARGRCGGRARRTTAAVAIFTARCHCKWPGTGQPRRRSTCSASQGVHTRSPGSY